jgi:hypothetical protein
MKGIFFLLRISIFGILVIASCRKEGFITDAGANLEFSTDTVYFDTIITTFGSVTNRFKIYNPHNKDIKIDELYLGGGSSSYYRLNVDGAKGNSHKNIEIRRKDSLYVFVELTINALNSNRPMIVTDSVVCLTNGNLQNVKLVSFGQDVNLFKRKIIKTQTWTADKPYLIYDYAVVDTGDVLTIEPGTQIFLHNNSFLLVLGDLQAKGTFESPIVFSGDRFDDWYENAAGQWGTIDFAPSSKNSLLEYVTIKNADRGLQVGSPEKVDGPEIVMNNCMILNSASLAILAFNAKITAYNSIIADCGQSMFFLAMGGDYNFYHLTANNISANYPGLYPDRRDYKPRSEPSLIAANFFPYYELDDDFQFSKVTYTNDLNLNFYNSIFNGSMKAEISLKDTSSQAFNYKFDHCIIRNHKDSLDYSDISHFEKIILNIDPQFVNDSVSNGKFDFGLDSLSPAIDSGSIELIKNIPQLQTDYTGASRVLDGKPDLGAFERRK